MKCAICKKTSEEITLFEGIYDAEMVNICEACSEDNGVPIIKKPSESQLDKAEERYTVRERMERMSGMRNRSRVSDEQIITQGNLAKLRAPPKKQSHEDVLDNYYWTLSMARRRVKITVNQLAEKIQVTPQVIQGIEKGKLPENFHEIFLRLEAFLDVKLLKAHEQKVNFTRSYDEKQEILKSVARKISHPEEAEESPRPSEIKLSKREDLSKITLNDLAERKRRQEKQRGRPDESTMIGDDIDLDEL
jgi:ribosome-binding protein aMBF1 (putative translation factor)